MAASSLEAARRAHEDVERLVHLCADVLAYSGARGGALTEHTSGASSRLETCGVEIPKTSRDAEHLACGLLDVARDRMMMLAEMNRPGGNIQEEHTADVDAARADPLSKFYAALRELKAAHQNAAAELTAPVDGKSSDAALLMLVPPPPEFSGEEGNGRYLDLHAHFSAYVNILYSVHARKESKLGKNNVSVFRNGVSKQMPEERTGKHEKRPRTGTDAESKPRIVMPNLEYVAYVKSLVTEFGSVPAGVRNSPPYFHYLNNLLKYLVSFADRSHPLAGVCPDLDKKEESLRNDLKVRQRQVRDRFSTAEDVLAGMGANQLRDELLMLCLKCGGKPLERAQRLLDASAIASPENPGHSREGQDQGGKDGIGERVVLEGLISYVMDDVLTEERRNTVLNIEKKQSLSWVELEAERVAEEAIAEHGATSARDSQVDEEESEQPVYNPKDVPLGWDGKPIPFWLYKLHGLNHEFNCEICGGATYKGPRTFERHFTDAQHINGLRCLGVSYSKHYYMVTRIADAQLLRDKIKQEIKRVEFDPDVEMEFEDSEGHVLNRKTLQDLERQGLL